MYEEIMKSTGNPFFALLNIVFPEKKKGKSNPDNSSDMESILDEFERKKDNEWMQEYYIIYNSYVLEGNEYGE
jgi:hypothetical protein